MRVRFLSRNAELTIICPKGADFSHHVGSETAVIRGRFPNKLGVIVESIRWLSMKRNRRHGMVVITEPSSIGIVGFIAKMAFALPWAVDVWDIPLRYLGTNLLMTIKNHLLKLVFRYLYRWADLFIVGILPDMGFRYFRVPREKILQWQTTININKNLHNHIHKDEKSPFQLLCMRSNHNRYMGLDILGNAFHLLEKKIPNIRLWIIGDIDRDVEKSITELRASPRVTFTGFMEHSNLLKLIAAVDCCVIPWKDVEDLAQTYPAKVMEYMTQGKVLVAPRIRGISEMIDDGYNGLLFTPGNYVELAEKIETLASDAKLREYISTNAKRYVAKFDGALKNQCILDSLTELSDDHNAQSGILPEGASQAKLRVVFVCSARPVSDDRNMNYYQRAHFLSHQSCLTIIAPQGADYSGVIAAGTHVLNSPWKGSFGHLAYAMLYFLKAGKKGRNNIVITGPSILGASGFIAKIATGCRWVVDVWDIPIRVDESLGLGHYLHLKLVRRIMKYLYRSADHSIVSIIPDMEFRYFGIPEEKMLILPNAIWQDSYSRQSTVRRDAHASDFTILCMRSTYSQHMGLDTLADAFISLKERIPGISMVIVGHIPPHVKKQVMKLEGSAQVRFIDHMKHEKLVEAIRDSSVCVIPFKNIPDLAQTYPIKILEYFSQGRPVVASNIAGISNMMKHGVNGLLFRAGDASDLAEKILTIYRDKELVSKITSGAAHLDERYDCRAKSSEILSTLNQLRHTEVNGHPCKCNLEY